MVIALDCGIVLSEFELQLRYYVHFRTNTPKKQQTDNQIMSPISLFLESPINDLKMLLHQ